jgi:hypothetical protein
LGNFLNLSGMIYIGDDNIFKAKVIDPFLNTENGAKECQKDNKY